MNQGRQMTDKMLEELEKKISKEYSTAEKEIKKKLEDYFRKFEAKDAIKRQQMLDGKITVQEYKQWRIGQMAIGERWNSMKDIISDDLSNATKIAKSTANGYMPEVYALNHNFATYEIEKAGKIDTSYTLYSRESVERIMRDDPQLLPPPGKRMKKKIASGAAKKWEKGKLQSAITQSILQGESVPNMATRIARDLCVSDRKAAIRYARTAVTEAENAGRMDGYERAQDMGIKVKKTWVATLDDRTRDAHRELDGQTVDIDKPFQNEIGEIMYPGDETADPENFWNCRCTMISQVEGFETNIADLGLRNVNKLGDMSYDEWKKTHGTSQDIEEPDRVAKHMKIRYINEDYRK